MIKANSILTILITAQIAGTSCSQRQLMGNHSTSIKLPEQQSYTNQSDFLRGRIQYYADEWVRKHPDKPFNRVLGEPWPLTNGLWGMETGPAMIAGPGLFVTVNDHGELVEIREIFSLE